MNDRFEGYPKLLDGNGVPALVLGAAYTVLAAARGLGRAGIPVICPANLPGSLAASRYILERPAGMGTLPEFTRLGDYLERVDLPEAVLVPCNDHWVREVAALPRHLAERFPSSSPSQGIVDILLDKARLSVFLKENALPAPLTMVLRSEDDIARWPEDRFTHSFLKPCDSLRFNSIFSRKAFRVTNKGEAVEAFRKASAQGLEMVLQEYIPGPGSNHYFIEGFIDAGGVLKGICARRRLRMYPLDFGDSTYSRAIPRADMGDMPGRLHAVLSAMRYRGIFSAELKLDPRDGRFKLLEINTRVWWQFGIAMDCGMNFVAMAYHDALGQPVESVNSYRIGTGWVAVERDKWACWGLYRKGELSFSAWLGSWLTSTKELFRWDDPGPFLSHARRQIFALPKRVFNKLIVMATASAS